MRSETEREDQRTTSTATPSGTRGVISARMLLRVTLLLIAAGALMQWWMTVLSYYVSFNGFYDFSFYYDAALALRANPHANLYDPHVLAAVAAQHHVFLGTGVFQYPPLLPIIFIPISHVSFGRASQLWLLFDAVLWLAGTLLLIGVLRRGLHGAVRPLPRPRLRGARPASWLGGLWDWWALLPDADLFAIATVTFVSLSNDPLQQALRLGQASMLVFFLIALAFWLLSRTRSLSVGLVLAAAVMIKALPIVLAGYFVLRGRWRIVAGTLAGCVALLAGMALVVGPQGLLAMRAIIGNGVGDSMRYQNEALARVPLWLGIAATGHPSTLLVNAGYGLIVLVAVAFVAGVFVAARRHRAAATLRGAHSVTFELLGFSWAVCTMLLVSPISWVHHSAWLLPPFVLCLGYTLARLAGGVRGATGRLRPEVYVVVALIVGLVLTMYPLPFQYDSDSTLALSQLFLHRPVRPLFMLLRPLGGLLLWFGSGALFLRFSESSAAVVDAPGELVAAGVGVSTAPVVVVEE
ncbi:MAG: glycosyltransferase 87 family protein [Ktedonobacterales bacterium]